MSEKLTFNDLSLYQLMYIYFWLYVKYIVVLATLCKFRRTIKLCHQSLQTVISTWEPSGQVPNNWVALHNCQSVVVAGTVGLVRQESSTFQWQLLICQHTCGRHKFRNLTLECPSQVQYTLSMSLHYVYRFSSCTQIKFGGWIFRTDAGFPNI